MMNFTRGCVAVFVGGVMVASATLAESQGVPQGAPADSSAARGASPPATDAHSRSPHARVRHGDQRYGAARRRGAAGR